MSRRSLVISGLVVGTTAFLLATVPGGCAGPVVQHLTIERTGNITVVLINNTPFTAACSFGTWDDLDRSPGPATLEQARVPANSSTTAATVPCRRNMAIGTRPFIDRVVATNTDENTTNFDADAFDTVVHFSSAPTDSPAAALPTAGTALGREVLLGVDYSCADQLMFTFVQDPDATGGFRIDFEVIRDVNKQ